MNRSILFGAGFSFLVLLLSSVNGVVIFGVLDSSVTRNNGHQLVAADAHTPHGPITITSNADFSSQAWPGNGTEGNPYTIEGLNITADAACVNITDTTVYFEIKDCIVSSGVASSFDGIVLDYVAHGTVRNCIIDMHKNGITLLDSSSCTLADNTASSDDYGIRLRFSNNCTLTDNTASSNLHGGFDLYYSNNCALTNNTASSNSNNGFYQRYSSGCTLTNNTSTYNTYGFFFEYSNSCTLTDNTATDNYLGFDLHHSDNCTLMNNTASRDVCGFALGESSSCALTSNNASGNSRYGLLLSSSGNCTLTNNTLVDNGVTISGSSITDWLHDMSGNTVNSKPLGYFKSIRNTIIDGTQYGQVILANCSDVMIKNGVFITALSGIQLGFCTNCTLASNTASSSSIGFYLISSNNCTLTSNIASSNGWGFFLSYSANCTLTNNTATGNYGDNFGGFALSVSDNCNLTDNTGSGNTFGFSLDASDNCTLMNNTASSTLHDGFYLNFSNNCTLISNTASSNLHCGIYLQDGSKNNRLYLNRMGDNSMSNARDDGESNIWDNSLSTGNYWSDYSGTGTYPIPGSAGSVDNYPFVWDTGIPIVNSPSDVEYIEGESGNSITWTPSDLHPHSYIIYMDGMPVKSGAWNSSSEVITISVDGLGPGTHNYTLVVTDIGENTATDTVIVTVTETSTIPDGVTIIMMVLGIGSAIVIIIIVISTVKKRQVSN